MLGLKDLAAIAAEHAVDLEAEVRPFDIAGQVAFPPAQPAIMGVINLSADSWYRQSICTSVQAAVERGGELRAQGAAIIDIGAESTLGQAQRVNATEQRQKLLPVIEQLASQGVIISAETYDVGVARACLEAGAKVLNLTGTADSETIYRLAAEHDAAVIVCYVAGDNVREVGNIPLDDDPIPRMADYFSREIETAGRCGLAKGFVDPGLGFYYGNLQDSSVRIRHQMKTFLNAFRLRKLGWPVCNALPHAVECFDEELRSAEPFFSVIAALGGTDLFRTHEVPRVRAVLRTLGVY
ncbi:MAG: dihydropteroate synthase [Verrucomicrobiota bacterium]|jgi:dihydropteroate synthase|nr:dihydropteroate synthase [Verrucomicrobiota bacterium]|tara:strand:- start:4004 stop:4891 length:888 start_codon:yes stop_codon:yes gene_type:complete